MAHHAILGLHHVTATVDSAQADLDFAIDQLGLRLVKKTVNFDNTGVYHFYYGTEHGAPGTIWTTFPYGSMGVRVGTKGAGQVVATALSVPPNSIDEWCAALEIANVATSARTERFGEPVLTLADPSGLVMELVGCEDSRQAWTGTIGATRAARGIHSVSMAVEHPRPSVAFLQDVLGYRVVNETDGRVRLATGGAEAGHYIDVVTEPRMRAVNGIGTVHHVAMAIETAEEQLSLRDALVRMGVGVTPVMDRCYFRSIYFREPGGVLFEVATVGPGFLIDEEAAALGRELRLPPWEESHRARIAAGLPAVTYR
jgi:glyoxalase family protein